MHTTLTFITGTVTRSNTENRLKLEIKHLRRHQIVVIPMPEIACESCGETFHTETELRAHVHFMRLKFCCQ